MSPQIMPSDPESRPTAPRMLPALEEDARLRNDIRLLGRILGDTVRDQEGADGVRSGRAHPADLDPFPSR